jgi:hypothetical protein
MTLALESVSGVWRNRKQFVITHRMVPFVEVI